MARKLEHNYTFAPGASGVGTVTLPALYKLNEILMITNVTTNQVIYNFSDSTRGGAITQTASSISPTTVIALDFDTSSMSSGHILQIYVETQSLVFKPSDQLIDPVSKFRVSQPNTLIDTDFEYGLQATKWETLELVNNIPGFFSRTGDTPLIITDASANSGSKIVTVTAANHGLTVGTPIDVRGLRQATLEGSYLVATVPDNNTFTFVGRVEAVNTGTLSGVYTTIIPGKFYAGSDAAYTSIETDGETPSTITVTTDYATGFTANTEFYLINTLGSTSVTFDSANAVIFQDNVTVLNSFEPAGVNSTALTSSGATRLDPWDLISTLGSKYFFAGAGGNVNANNSVTITAHGYKTGNNQAVAIIPGPGSTVPTGLAAHRGYFVKVVNTNVVKFSTTLGGADVAITNASGSGIIGLYSGFYVSAVAATDLLTLSGDRALFFNNVTNTTPMAWFTSNATANVSGLQTTAAGFFSRTNPGNLYNGGSAFSSGTGTGSTGYVFTRAAATQNTISLASGPSGTNVDITATGVATQTILVPLVTNTTKDTLYLPSHGYLNNEPVFYWHGGGTAIGGLTSNVTYFVDFVNTNVIGLKPTAVGARLNLGTFGSGTAHQLQYNRPRADGNTIQINQHGYIDGSAVVYNSNGGTEVAPLVNGTTYFVRDAQVNSFRLAESIGQPAIDFSTAGTGTQSFGQPDTGTFDGSYVSNVIINSTQFTLRPPDVTVPVVTRTFASASVFTSNSTILLPDHRLPTGSNVLYSDGSGTTIGGLTDGEYFFINRVNKDRVRLAGNLQAALDGTPLIGFSTDGTGTDHSLVTKNLAGEIQGTGTVSVVSGSKTVTGSGTLFLRTFKSGDDILIDTGTAIVEGIVEYVLSDTKIQAVDTYSSTLSGRPYLLRTGFYIKAGAFSLHRPFDGGVEINAGLRADTQIVRQTRRYFRYQSGKGMQASFAINFNPPIDIQNLSASGTTATATTRKVHGLRIGQQITIRDAEVQTGVNYFNGDFVIDGVPDELTITFQLAGTPSVSSANGFPQLVITDWGGSKMRAGMYDFQNGMYFEYDGADLYCVRRNATQQLAGSLTVTKRSNRIVGTGTLFINQLSVDDFIVIRGQTYKVTAIDSNSSIDVQPAYRGITQDQVIASIVQEERVSQSNWSLDPCDGTGPSRYVLDNSRIQMVYMDYAWYGAGKVRFGFKGVEGEVFYCHEFKHNNRKTEAYLRSGNLPARYEIINEGAPLYAPSLAHWGTSVIMDGTFEDDNAYLFTAPSVFQTYSGSAATVTGESGINYFYVNVDGTTGNTISTSANVTMQTASPANVTINTTSEGFTYNNHGFTTGQLVRFQLVSGTGPGGLTNTAYYFTRRLDVNNFTLHATPAAVSSNVKVNITSTGTGRFVFVKDFNFTPTFTNIPGYGNRIVHRLITNASGFAAIGSVPFGTRITSTAIATRTASGTQALVYRVNPGIASGAAFVDFFFTEALAPTATTATTGPLASTGFMAASTSSAVAHSIGSDTSIPTVLPLISIRSSPSVDSGLVGALGERDVINRMQMTLKSVGVSTTHDVELRLILNGQLDNQTWVNQGIPSLSQLCLHEVGDTITGGVQIFNFRATGNSPTAAGLRTANTFSADITSLLALGNAILGGDGSYPDGPDILTLVAIPLSTTGITVNSPFSVAGRITWSESQA
jgi:hypothetical protein